MDDKLLSCRDCGAMISKNCNHCPKCGAPNYVKKRKIALLTGIVNLIFLIFLLSFIMPRFRFFKSLKHHDSPRARPAAQIRR